MLSQKLEQLAHACEGRREMSFKEVLELLGAQGPAFVSIILSLPFVLLVPAPGLSILLGAVILLNGVRIARKRPLWLPKRFYEKKVSGDLFAKELRRPIKFLKWLETFVKPRGIVFQQHPALQLVNGWFLAMSGFFLLLSFPSGTHFLPGLAALFLSLGILEEDILFVCLGYLAFFANLIFLVLIPLLLAQNSLPKS
jgi:hypothetical protein